MLIDWFTVGAQVLNFLVLVALLRHFLYKPILNAIEAREKRIVDQLADAQAKNAAAQTSREEFEGKIRTFDEQRTTMLAKATDEANSERERLIAEARKNGDALRATQAGRLQAERAALGSAITRQVSDEVFEIARKTLADLAAVSLEERMAEVFTRRLREIDAETRAALTEALRSAGNNARLRSRFDLGAAPRAGIQNVLEETFSADVHVQFETTAEGVCGIELNVGGQTLAWNIADYLGTLEERLDALLDCETRPADAVETAAVPAPQARAA